MAGEDEIDDLQEDSEEGSSLYEQMLGEEGGTGTVDNYHYDYDESSSTNEATDLDYQSGNESSAFTDGYNSNDDFNPTGDNKEEDENGNNQNDNFGGEEAWDDRNGNARQNNDDDDNEQNVNHQKDGNADEGTDEGKKAKGKNKEDVEEKQEASGEQKGDKAKKQKSIKRDPYVGTITWHPGDPITIELLSQTWGSISKVEGLASFVKVANESVSQFLNSTGPNLMLRLNRYVCRLSDNAVDTIGSILNLLASNGKKLLYTSLGVVKAIFDQQWLEVTLLAGLSNAVKAVLKVPFVSKVLNAIFAVGVRVINSKSKNK